MVAAGLVPSYLYSSPEDDTVSKPKRRRITKARVLTENEYVEMMKEKDRKKEAEELKKKRKEEREEKRREKERQKREREEEEGKRGREGEEKERERKDDKGKEKARQACEVEGRPKKGKQPVQAAMESDRKSVV